MPVSRGAEPLKVAGPLLWDLQNARPVGFWRLGFGPGQFCEGQLWIALDEKGLGGVPCFVLGLVYFPVSISTKNGY